MKLYVESPPFIALIDPAPESTTTSFLITKNISGSRTFPVCGIGPSQLDLPGVSQNKLFQNFISDISSEAFAATGWRVGWLIGHPSIILPTLAASTRIVFCTNSPLQEAAAAGFEQAKGRKYFETQLTEYTERRAILTDAFDQLGLKYTLPEGTYFVLLVNLENPLVVEFV